MIANLLKIIFFYCIYRFIKVILKGYIFKKVKSATDQVNQQMRSGGYQGYDRPDLSKEKIKTFDAEYTVMKE